MIPVTPCVLDLVLSQNLDVVEPRYPSRSSLLAMARRAPAPNPFLARRDAWRPACFAHRVGYSLVLQLVSCCYPIRANTQLWS
jgi:hypothetical protein